MPEPHAQRDDRRGEWMITAGVAAVSLLFHLIYFRHGVQNLVDLGVACVDAERILDGQVPGRDFLEPYGPARFYITALAFWIGGRSLLTFSVVCLIFLTLKDAIVYRASRVLLSRPFALFVAALSIMVHGPLHKVFLTFAAMLVLWPALALAVRPRSSTAFALGLCVAAAGCFRYDAGAAGLIASIMLIALLPRAGPASDPGRTRAAGCFLAGLAALGGPAAFLYLHGVDLAVFFGHHLKRLHSLEQANAGAPGPLDLPASSLPEERLLGFLLLALALVAAAVAVQAFRLLRREGAHRRTALALLVLLAMSLLLYNQVRLGVKFSRLGQIAPPYFMAFAFLLQTAWRRKEAAPGRRALRWLCPSAAAGLFLFLAAYLWSFEGMHSQDAFSALRLNEYFVEHPRARCYFKRKKGMEIEEVVRYLERVTAEGEPVFTGPSCPLFHFLARRPNPTPFTDFTFYYFDEENQREMVKILDRAGVRYAVNWPRELTGFLFVESAPVLTDYLSAHFATERRIGRFMILKRRD
jgi:hypothetical protein